MINIRQDRSKIVEEPSKQKSININTRDTISYIKFSCKMATTVNEIAKRKIIELSAQKAEISLDASEIQQAADNFRVDNQLYDIEDTYSWLENHCLSLDDFETLIYINALTEKLARHLFTEKIEPWFYGHQLDYAAAVIYEVILPESDLAMELFCGLQEKEICFHEVARQHIQDLSLRRAGGYLGVVNRQTLQPEISAAVFEASPPQILKPIQTDRGSHLILVEEIIEPELNEELRQQILAHLFAVWLEEEVQKVKINVDIPEAKAE